MKTASHFASKLCSQLFVCTTLIGLCIPNATFAAAAANGGGSGTGHILSAVPMPEGEWQYGISTDYYSGANVGAKKASKVDKKLQAIDGEVDATDAVRTDINMAVNYAPTSFLELGAVLPYYNDKTPAGAASGIGDIQLTAKLNYPIEDHFKGYELSYFMSIIAPTASKNVNGFQRNAWAQVKSLDEAGFAIKDSEGNRVSSLTEGHPYGAVNPVVILKLLNTANLKAIPNMTPLLFHFNFGLALSGGNKTESAFLLGGGAEFWFNDNFAVWYAGDGQMNISHADKNIFGTIASYPISHWIGGSLRLTNALQLDVGFEKSTYNKADSKVMYQTYSNGVASSPFISNRVPDMGYHVGLTYNFGAEKSVSTQK